MANIDIKDIYDYLENKVSEVQEKLKIHDKNEDDGERLAKEAAYESVSDCKEILDKNIKEYKENQELDTYTIAFYGETNAGKSTLIESLRLLLKEKTKVEATEKFNSKVGEITKTKDALSALEEKVKNELEKEYADILSLKDKFSAELESRKNDFSALLQRYTENLRQEEQKINHFVGELYAELSLNDDLSQKNIKDKIEILQIREKTRKVSFFQKIKFFFFDDDIRKKMKVINDLYSKFILLQNEQEKTVDKENKKITELESMHKNTINEKENSLANIKQEREKVIFDEKRKLDDYQRDLAKYEDGAIIGNGKSDFTISNSEYRFSLNDQDFKIIDMPGIEGDEKIVISEIEKAVKQAHCVFFVTSEPKPPQKGENGKKGTIEKIKEHLSAQSEVYTIYNKRITSPRPLNHDIISEDIVKSLNVLDQKMSEILGKHYAHTKILSARIAFLSLASSIAPGSSLEVEQAKFLAQYSKDELLEKSLITQFSNFLSNELVANTKEKIRRSNISKAKSVLFQFIQNIKDIIKSYEPLCADIKSSYEDGKFALENTLRGTKNEIESCADACVMRFEEESGEKIYNIIDTNISDDDFKYELKIVIEDQMDKLKSELDDKLKLCFDSFNKKLTSDIEEFKRKISINIKDFKDNVKLNSDIDLSINIDNGIDKIGLASSLIGAGALAWVAGSLATGGALAVATLVIGVVTVVISFVKSIQKFFSDSYKMREQKKAADENIRKQARQIKRVLNSEFEKIFEKMEEQIDVITNEFYQKYESMNQMLKHFNNTQKELENISKNFK